MCLISGGFHYWYYMIESKITVHMQSRPNTPVSTPRGSQVSLNLNDLTESNRSHSRSHLHLPHLAALHRTYEPVGVLESQTYTDLEATFQTSLNEKPTHYEDMVMLVSSSCADLLGECERGMSVVIRWLESVNSDRLYSRLWKRHTKAAERREISAEVGKAVELLRCEIDRFQQDKRLEVLEPHMRWFQSETHKNRQPSYRLLFSSFFYQFHLREFAVSLHAMLEQLHEDDATHQLPHWWVPSFMEVSKWLAKGGENKDKASNEDLACEDQDPEHIPHITNPEDEAIQVQPRNPDAGPPSNVGHLVGRFVVKSFKLITRADIFYAIKAGIVTVLVALPIYFKSTAGWFYFNRGIWAVIMTALTISQFTADTMFGFVVRLVATFLGALLAMVIWYIGSGGGDGNAFGLSAVLAVVLPFILFIRVNFVYHLNFYLIVDLHLTYASSHFLYYNRHRSRIQLARRCSSSSFANCRLITHLPFRRCWVLAGRLHGADSSPSPSE